MGLVNDSASSGNGIIQWQRFWCPLGSVIHCGLEGQGYLTDPTDKYGRHANPNAKSLFQILPKIGPLVLCGEPGIGKTMELENAGVAFENDRHQQGGHLSWIVFRDVADSADFRRLTVDSPDWQAWRGNSSTMTMTLVVDGVDEGLLRVPNFINDLVALLKREPIARLRLVLVCRTAEWPIEMGRRLTALWSEQSASPFYELCPLRQKDVELAASTRGVDAARFLEAVWERRVTGLAARPVTLFFLLREFRDGELPGTHRELYERGTRNLVREINPARLELVRALRRTANGCSDEDRYRAAQRLAALLLLTGRSAIWQTGGGFEDLPPHDLPVDAAADAEGVVTRDATGEAIESALFTSLGERRYGFAHQTFAECLAAQHLSSLPLVQLRALLCQRDVRGEHIIPQLAELAAWTAGYHTGFCEHLLIIEPESLLRSDVTRLQGNLKARLVSALLDGAEQERIFDGLNFGRFLDGLKHPGLATQLLPYTTDKGKHYIARRIALNIAARCKLQELTDAILAVIYDASEDSNIRDSASDTLEDIVPDERLNVLEPLARGEAGADPNDTIRGHALRRLMPAKWKVRDALPFLVDRTNNRIAGVYSMMLRYTIPKMIEDADVGPCLVFIRSRARCLDSIHPFRELAMAAFTRALSLLNEPSVSSEFIETWQAWVERHELHYLEREPAHTSVLQDAAIRRCLAKLYLNHPKTEPNSAYHLCWPLPILNDSQDLAWLLNEIPSAPDGQKKVWAAAIGQLASDPQRCAPCWDLLLQRIDEIPELAAQFSWLRAWGLDEQIARDAKARWLRDQRRRAQYERWEQENAPPDIRAGLDEAFAAFSNGKKEAWFWIWSHIAHDETGASERIFECDLTKCPNWALLSPDEAESCSGIARAFLFELEPRASEFEGVNEVGLAAGAAIWLLQSSLNHDAELAEVVKRAWLPSLVWHVDTASEPRRMLFKLAYGLAPEATVKELSRQAKDDMEKHSHPFAFRAAREVWNPALSDAFVAVLFESTSPKSVLNGLTEFASYDRQRAVDVSMGIIRSVSPGGPAYPIHLLATMIIALSCGAAEHWNTLEPFLASDDELARAVSEKVLFGVDVQGGDLFAQLNERGLADFYLLLHKLFPVSSDPPRPQGGFLSARDSVRHTRDNIPSVLAARGTEEGCRQLLRLAGLLPDQATGLRWTYRDAVTNVRRNLWRPPLPEAVNRLLSQPKTRLLQSEDDLQELVLESLARLQLHLTGQVLPAVEDLWRWEGGGNARHSFRPKDEEALSDYIARWLTNDLGPSAGVVVGREVQPRRGLRTDIYVEAVASQASGLFEKFTVVVEVKGCWHLEVQTALRTQLAEDYLRGHGLRCGIYLVGWFACERWNDTVNKLASDDIPTARLELETIAAEFADGLSDLRIAAVLLDCTF